MKVINDFCGYCGNYLGPVYNHETKQFITGKSCGDVFWLDDCQKCVNKPNVTIDGSSTPLPPSPTPANNCVTNGEVGVPVVGEIANVEWRERKAPEAIGRTRYRKSITGNSGAAGFLDFFEPGCRYTLTRNKIVNGADTVEKIERGVVMVSTTRSVGEIQRDKRVAYLCPECREEQSPRLFEETKSGKCQVCGIEFKRVVRRYRRFPWTILNLFGRR